jgi:hypothetical protein
VLHNSAHGLEACLDGVREPCAAGFAELVAVDNASPDSSADVLRTRMPDATLIRSGRNIGFAAGCNMAWPAVRGRYWLLLNPDTEVPAGVLPAMVSFMDSHPRVGVSSPHLVDRDGGSAATARRFPSIGLSLLELSRLHRMMSPGLRGRVLLGTYLSGTPETAADWVPGTAMLLRRAAVEQVGSLSERFFMYGEDVEFCWRVRRAGWEVRLPAALTVRHLGRASADRSWGPAETRRRNLAGWYGACSVTRGRGYALGLMLLDWLALRTEAALPWKSAVWRSGARDGARLLAEVRESVQGG